MEAQSRFDYLARKAKSRTRNEGGSNWRSLRRILRNFFFWPFIVLRYGWEEVETFETLTPSFRLISHFLSLALITGCSRSRTRRGNMCRDLCRLICYLQPPRHVVYFRVINTINSSAFRRGYFHEIMAKAVVKSMKCQIHPIDAAAAAISDSVSY